MIDHLFPIQNSVWTTTSTSQIQLKVQVLTQFCQFTMKQQPRSKRDIRNWLPTNISINGVNIANSKNKEKKKKGKTATKKEERFLLSMHCWVVLSFESLSVRVCSFKILFILPSLFTKKVDEINSEPKNNNKPRKTTDGNK